MTHSSPNSPLDNRSSLAAPGSGTVVLLAALYCAQGLPSGLIAHALPILMRQNGVDLVAIGMLKLLALPWVLKVIWAPWVDRLASARWGHHRGWILPLQATVLTVLIVIASLPPQDLFGAYLPVLLGLLLVVNLAAATQDVATDGLAVKLLPERWRGLGNSLQVGGYKVGMIVSGSMLLLVVERWGWGASMGMVAALVGLTTLPVLLFPEKRRLPRMPALAEPAGPHLLWRHYRGFLALPAMGSWLAVVLAFKIGDAIGSPMIKPLLVDLGWSSMALGRLTLVSSLVGVGGAVLGGALYARLGAQRSLLLFGFLQALGIAAMAWLARSGGDAPVVYAIALFEQVADGMSTVALFAMMMNQCRPEHEGADFTLQACSQVVLAGVIGSLSGMVAKRLGYEGHFLLAGLLGLLALALVVLYFAKRPAATPPPFAEQ